MSRLLPHVLAVSLALAGSPVLAENLADAYRHALDSDPQLGAAAAGHSAALEARPQSQAALLPSVGLTAQTQWNSLDLRQSSATPGTYDYNSHNYSLSLRQALYHRDALVQLKQADARILQADAELGAARQALLVRVAEAYFNLLAASDNLAFAQAEKRAIEQQLNQTQQRFEVGLTAITDVREAQAAHDAVVAQEIVAQNQLENAREVLREITGRDYPALSPLASDIPLLLPEPNDIAAWVDTALEQNLQLLASAAAATIAREEMARRESGHYPSLDLVASHSWSDTTESPLFGSERVDNIVGLQLSVPLYAGGAVTSQTREAAHLHTQAQEVLEQTRRATVRQARDAYLGVTAGISQVQARKQALSSARTALEATQASFEVGIRTMVDVLASQRELFRAERDYARARYDYALSTLRLKQAAGILADNDLDQINGWLN